MPANTTCVPARVSVAGSTPFAVPGSRSSSSFVPAVVPSLSQSSSPNSACIADSSVDPPIGATAVIPLRRWKIRCVPAGVPSVVTTSGSLESMRPDSHSRPACSPIRFNWTPDVASQPLAPRAMSATSRCAITGADSSATPTNALSNPLRRCLTPGVPVHPVSDTGAAD